MPSSQPSAVRAHALAIPAEMGPVAGRLGRAGAKTVPCTLVLTWDDEFAQAWAATHPDAEAAA